MIIRPFAPADFSPTLGLLRQSLTLLALDENLFARDFLLAQGFAPEHLLVAEVDGAVAGFVLAPRHDALAPGRGWIAAFGVAPEYQRRGIGTGLLEQAIADMRGEGVSRIDVADVPVRYLLPGVDRQAFSAAWEMLVRSGFELRDEVASMGIWLDGEFDTAPTIRAAEAGEYFLVRDFLNAEFDPGWWAFIERSIFARLSGDPAPSEVLCWWEDGRPLGIVHYRQNRFGPLAVAAAGRGHGIGAALTHAALARIKAAGFPDAYFMIAVAEVEPFYARLGFSVRRRFSRMTLRF